MTDLAGCDARRVLAWTVLIGALALAPACPDRRYWTEDENGCLYLNDSSVLATIPSDPDVDDDGDGFTENSGDCADYDCSRYPGAVENGDGVDRNCDGVPGERLRRVYCEQGAGRGGTMLALAALMTMFRRRSLRA
jgi:hypothetical protein